MVAALDRRGIDGLADGLAHWTTLISSVDNWIDCVFVDGLVNLIARWSYRAGISLRALQTGNLRQYVMFIAVGTVALFVLVSLYWNLAMPAVARAGG
jgi:NADH:ubiquinone oxidoreductase subunit 5 (subunit L)/multisubunit Na+/H+ antiporter MnhA subunit